MGPDDGVIRDSGGVLGSRMEPDRRGILLYTARQGRPVRLDGTGGQGLSDRGRKPSPVKGRNLSSLLSDEPGGGPRLATVGAQQTARLQHHERGAAGVWGFGEGDAATGAVGDCGGTAGRCFDRG